MEYILRNYHKMQTGLFKNEQPCYFYKKTFTILKVCGKIILVVKLILADVAQLVAQRLGKA